mgnify:CR=1 FL=1
MQEHVQQAERNARLKEIEQEKIAEQKEQEEARKNRDFTQVYAKGWRRIMDMSKVKGSNGAIGLYAWFAQHIDPSCGAVICDQQFIADEFEVTTRTIRNWLSFLEERNAIIKIPVSGRVCAYALDPHEVWKGYNTSKNYAAFTSKTLVNKDEAIERRIQMMMSAKREKERKAKLEENGQTLIDHI